jgi:hypothetical protein
MIFGGLGFPVLMSLMRMLQGWEYFCVFDEGLMCVALCRKDLWVL